MSTLHDHSTFSYESFVIQLILPQQLALTEYWNSLRGPDGDWPRWRDFHLSELRGLAANLLLLEPLPMPEGMVVRLAGSALWDIHGREITGLSLTHEHWNHHDSYWRRVHERMLQQLQPDCGHLNDPERGAVIFWLRLPVRGNDESVWLLGLDIAVSMSRAAIMNQQSRRAAQMKEGVAGNSSPSFHLSSSAVPASVVRIRQPRPGMPTSPCG